MLHVPCMPIPAQVNPTAALLAVSCWPIAQQLTAFPTQSAAVLGGEHGSPCSMSPYSSPPACSHGLPWQGATQRSALLSASTKRTTAPGEQVVRSSSWQYQGPLGSASSRRRGPTTWVISSRAAGSSLACAASSDQSAASAARCSTAVPPPITSALQAAAAVPITARCACGAGLAPANICSAQP